jgi:hypothetical protein
VVGNYPISGAPAATLSVGAGFEFEEHFVRDPGAFTPSDDIWDAVKGGYPGDRDRFFKELVAWGGNALKRRQGPRPARAWGYSGVRLR